MTNNYTIHCTRRLSRTRQPEQVYDHLVRCQAGVRTMSSRGSPDCGFHIPTGRLTLDQ